MVFPVVMYKCESWTTKKAEHRRTDAFGLWCWRRLFFFFFKLYITVLVLPNIKVNPPQVYMCSPSWTLLPPPSPFHPSGSSQCTSPKHPVSCIEPGLASHFIHDILHVSMPFSQIFPPSHIQLFVTPWTGACQAPLSMEFSSQEYWSG